MAEPDERNKKRFGGLKFTNSLEIPKPVRRWLKISYVLNFLIGSGFIIATYRNYLAANMFGDEQGEFFFFLTPFILHMSYFYAKEHLRSNQDRFDGIYGLKYDIDFDDFLIMWIKMAILISLGVLLAEVVGNKEWTKFWDQVAVLTQHVADTVIQEMTAIARKLY